LFPSLSLSPQNNNQFRNVQGVHAGAGSPRPQPVRKEEEEEEKGFPLSRAPSDDKTSFEEKQTYSDLSGDELQLGVTLDSFYARARPAVEGAQWTGIVTSIAVAMLETKTVDAVVCVQSEPGDRLAPLPVVARTKEDILASRGVKPSLSPNLSVLATVEALGPEVRSLLFVGVGCQVQALRSVSKYLNLEKLFVLGTNCTDNGPREG
jgi:coenzyme F420-reducing hydrogenase beta subunit